MIRRKAGTGDEVRKLKVDLLLWSDSYYNRGESIVPDHVFDSSRDKLQTLINPNDPFFTTIGSPIPAVSDFKKAVHRISMLSQNKVNEIHEFEKWVAKIGDTHYIAQDKLDGISIDLEYDSGKLTKAITRGDGETGEDIVNNVRKMKNVRLTIPGFTGSIRAEIFLFIDDFEAVNRILEQRKRPPLKNPRNGANGIAKRYDGSLSEYLSLLYYDIECAELDFETEEEKVDYLRDTLKLKVCFSKKVTVDECIQLWKDFEDHLRAETPYDIDGLVIKANSIKLQKKFGASGGRPEAQRAWKFTAMRRDTVLEDIIWSNGNNRRITPIGVLRAVQIGGARVTHATLHNLDLFKKLKPGKGDDVVVSRRNDVIPYLEEIKTATGNYFEVPTHCPTCGTEVVENGKFLECPNDECKALDLGNLSKWIYGLDIKDFGLGLIEALYMASKVKEPADFYDIKPTDISELEGRGDKTATKVLKNLHAKKALTLPEFLGNLNINGVGDKTIETLVEAGFDSLDKIKSASVDDLVTIRGIGETTAENILNGITIKAKQIQNLLDAGITVKEIEKAKIESDKFKGLSFCFTGAIQQMNDKTGKRFTRTEMQDLVIANSGTVSAVKKGLTYLVMADPNSTSAKTQKATQLGITLLSEADFFKMVED